MVYKKGADNKGYRFQHKTISIVRGDKAPLGEVEAWESLDVPGLAMHKRYGGPGWVVVHIKSGMKLPGIFKAQFYAVTYIQFLRDKAEDWTVDQDSLIEGNRALSSVCYNYVRDNPDHIRKDKP